MSCNQSAQYSEAASLSFCSSPPRGEDPPPRSHVNSAVTRWSHTFGKRTRMFVKSPRVTTVSDAERRKRICYWCERLACRASTNRGFLVRWGLKTETKEKSEPWPLLWLVGERLDSFQSSRRSSAFLRRQKKVSEAKNALNLQPLNILQMSRVIDLSHPFSLR